MPTLGEVLASTSKGSVQSSNPKKRKPGEVSTLGEILGENTFTRPSNISPLPEAVSYTPAPPPQSFMSKAGNFITSTAKRVGTNLKDLPKGVATAVAAPFMTGEQLLKFNPKVVEPDYAKRISGTFFDVGTAGVGGAELKGVIGGAKAIGKQGVKQIAKLIGKTAAVRGVEGGAMAGSRSASQGDNAKEVALNTALGFATGGVIGAAEKPLGSVVSKFLPKKAIAEAEQKAASTVAKAAAPTPEFSPVAKQVEQVSNIDAKINEYLDAKGSVRFREKPKVNDYKTPINDYQANAGEPKINDYTGEPYTAGVKVQHYQEPKINNYADQPATKPKINKYTQGADGKLTGSKSVEKFRTDPDNIRKYKTVDEYIDDNTIYHGGDKSFISKLKKTGKFVPDAERDAGTGGNLYGLSTSKDFMTAKDFSTSSTGNPDIAELFINPKAKVYELKGKAIDDLSDQEIRDISKRYDVIKDVDNIGGEGEVRVLNPNGLSTNRKSLEDFYNKSQGNEKFRLADDFKAATGMDLTPAQENDINALDKHIFGESGNVKIVPQILANKDAVGSYKEGMIKVIAGQADPKETYYHEAVHKYFDVFSTREEQVSILRDAVKKYGIEDMAQVEEHLAEDFIAYAKSREGVTGKIKVYFDSILNRVKGYFDNADNIDMLYNDILSGKAAKEGAPSVNAASALPEATAAPVEAPKPNVDNLRAQAQVEQQAAQESQNAAELNALKSSEPQKTPAQIAREKLDQHVENQRQQYEGAQNTLELANNRLDGQVANLKLLIQNEERRKTGFDVTKIHGFDEYTQLLRDATNDQNLTTNDLVEYVKAVPSQADINRLKPTELIPTPTGEKKVSQPREVAPPAKPVGMGKEKQTRLFQRVKNDLVMFQGEDFADSTYHVAHDDQQIKKAVEFVSNDFEGAVEALRTGKKMPAVLPNALFSATASEAIERGEFGIAAEMANKMSQSSTAKGQDISFLRNVGKDTPLGAMAEVSRLRAKAQGGVKEVAAKMKEATVTETKKLVSLVKSETIKSSKQWADLIEGLRC